MAFWRRYGPELSLLLTYFLLETLWAAWNAPVLPLGPAVRLLTLPVLLIAAWSALRLADTPAVPTWLLPLLTAAVLTGKMYVVSGARPPFLYAAGALVVPLLAVYGIRRWLQEDPGYPPAWGAILGVSLLLSSDLTKVIWLQAGAGGTFRPGMLLLLLFGTGLGAWLFVRYWKSARRMLAGGSSGILSLVGLLVLAAGVQIAVHTRAGDRTSDPPDWLAELETTVRAPKKLPNIVLISIDTLRWDMVPPRAEDLELPNLTTLRKDSLTFDHAFSETSWTLPAHVSLFTGLLPVEHGVQLPKNRIDPTVPLLPRVLRAAGYRTAAMTDGGYLHRKYGYDRGFDLYWQHGEAMPQVRHRHFVPGVLEVVVLLWNRIGSTPRIEFRHRVRQRIGKPRHRYFEPNLRVARKWIKNRGTVSPSPFFLFLHTYEVHDHGNRKDPEYEDKVKRLKRKQPSLVWALTTDLDLADTFMLSDSQWARFSRRPPTDLSRPRRRFFRRTMRRFSPGIRSTFKQYLRLLSPDERRQFQRVLARRDPQLVESFLELSLERRQRIVRRQILKAAYPNISLSRRKKLAQRRLYAYGVENVDESLGAFLRWMKRRGLYRDSLIVFLSDHGEGFDLLTQGTGHGKGRLSEPLTRVPFWIKLPREKHAGRTLSHPIQLRDLFPILLEQIGIHFTCAEDVPCPETELSETPSVPRPGRSHARTSIAYQIPANENKTDTGKRVKLGIRGKTYKQIRPAHGPRDSFYRVYPDSLRQERVETESLDPAARDRLEGLMERYDNLRRRAPNPWLDQQSLDQDVREDLKGLGYL